MLPNPEVVNQILKFLGRRRDRPQMDRHRRLLNLGSPLITTLRMVKRDLRTILPYLMEQTVSFSQKLRQLIHLLERLATQQIKCLSNLKIKIPNNNLWANAINLLTPNKLLQRPAGERNKPTPSMWMSCKAHPNLQVMFSHRLPQL